MTFDGLEGKRTLITGSSSGIGKEIALAFAQAGATVGIHFGENKNKAEAVLTQIQEYGTISDLFPGNLTDIQSALKLIETFVERFGGIDILVNNAGSYIQRQPVLELDVETFENALRLNTLSPFFMAQKSIHQMMKQENGGRIINISSIGVKYGGGTDGLHYSVSKAALEQVTRGLAKIGAPHNILVNAVRPGLTDTPTFTNLKSNLEKRINMIPLKRMGKPSEIAQMVLFLSSCAGNFITGQIIAVSGGD